MKHISAILLLITFGGIIHFLYDVKFSRFNNSNDFFREISPDNDINFKLCYNNNKLTEDYQLEKAWNEINKFSESCEFITIGSDDDKKNICKESLTTTIDVISIGSSGNWVFEKNIKPWSSKIITFDGNGDIKGRPDFVEFFHKCVGSSCSLDQVFAESNFHNKVLLKIDVGYNEWNTINDVIRMKTPPDILLIKIHLDPIYDCNTYLRSQMWFKLLDKKYKLMNWRRVINCKHCIETTYLIKSHDAQTIDNNCYFKFNIINEGLGGSISQIMTGIIIANAKGKIFCLSNSLVDPDPSHMNDYSWFQKIFRIKSCPKMNYESSDCLDCCNIEEDFRTSYWHNTGVLSQFLDIKSQDILNAQDEIYESPLNKKFKFCVHIRVGDMTDIPSVDWKDLEIQIFGPNKNDNYKFCEVNRCLFHDPDVIYDFVNLATCEHLISSYSTFPVLANIFNKDNRKITSRLPAFYS
jgi:hypothetical protein